MRLSRPRHGKSVPANHECATGAVRRRAVSFVLAVVLSSAMSGLMAGCAAMHPMSGIPVACLPPELQVPSRGPRRTIDLSLLRQPPPAAYRVDSGDVLGVYIEGILGRHEDVPPVTFPVDRDQANALGYPIPVRDDGTISLPLIPPLSVRGYTMAEVERAIRETYTRTQPLLRPGQDRILVSLQKPRIYHVLVIRQEGTMQHNVTRVPSMANVGSQKRGVGMIVALPAYQNDVMHALAQTGGLPGLDAENAVYIMRRGRGNFPEFAAEGAEHHPPAFDSFPPPAAPSDPAYVPPRPLPSRAPRIEPNFPPPSAPPAFEPAPAGIDPAAFQRGPRRPAYRPMGPPGPEDVQNAIDWHTIRGQSPDGPSAWSGPASQPNRGAQAGHSTHHTAYQSRGRYGASAASRPAATQVAGWSSPMPSARPTWSTQPAWSSPFAPSAAGGEHHAYPPADYGMPHGMDPLAGPFAAMQPLPYVLDDASIRGPGVMRIPLSIAPGETPQFAPQDVILQDGDVLFIETRQDEFFYTGGLLGGGKFTLPQDRDLDVLEAVLLAESDPIRTLPSRAIGGVSALNQDVTVGASEVVILRQAPGGGQVRIKVDLYDALRYPEERTLIQPGDYLFLQYTRMEGIMAFIERHLLEGAVVGWATSQTFSN
ncbi:MAG: polysaccharide biosynthesis/export family protein [Planctomycetaceae bacterium]